MADEGEEDVCVVCMESLSAEHAHTMEECGHRFHSRCIIGWLQRGHLNCPTCRGNLHQTEESGIPAYALRDRAKYIRRTLGRRANIPAGLKRLLAKLRNAEGKEREHRQNFREFREANKEIIKQYNTLRRKRWTHMRTQSRWERLLGLYQAPGFSLPALMVQQYRF